MILDTAPGGPSSSLSFLYISPPPPPTADKPYCVPQCSSPPFTSSSALFPKSSCGYTSPSLLIGRTRRHLFPPSFHLSHTISWHRCSLTHPGWSSSAPLSQFMIELRHNSLHRFPALAPHPFITSHLSHSRFPRATPKRHRLNPSLLLYLAIAQSCGSMHSRRTSRPNSIFPSSTM